MVRNVDGAAAERIDPPQGLGRYLVLSEVEPADEMKGPLRLVPLGPVSVQSLFREAQSSRRRLRFAAATGKQPDAYLACGSASTKVGPRRLTFTGETRPDPD